MITFWLSFVKNLKNNINILILCILLYSKQNRHINYHPAQEEPDVLNTAKEAAIAQLEKYKNFMADENNATYKDGLPTIEKAITDIGKASSAEEVQELLDKAIKGVSEETKKAIEDLEKEKTDALADLQKYLAASDSLNDEDKARLQSFVTEATKKIKSANSEKGVEDAVGTFNELMSASKTLEAVAVQKAKNDAKAALEECRDTSKPALDRLIDKAIEDIEAMNNVDDITAKMDSLLKNPEDGAYSELGKIIKLKNAQKLAYEELKAYEDYLTANELSEAEKRNIQNEINTVKELIDNAEDADSIYKYTANDPAQTLESGAMFDFRKFMTEKYKSTDDAVKFEVAKKELADKYQDYLTKLAPYLASSDENIKAIAQNAKETMKKIAEPEVAYTTIDQITNETTGALKKLEELYLGKDSKNSPSQPDSNEFYKLSDVKDKDVSSGNVVANFAGYKTILEYNDTLAKKLDKEDKEAREAEYEKAIEILDLYETVLKDTEAVEALKLSADDINSIQSMLDATRSTVSKATGAKEIKDALALLRDSTTVAPEEKTGFLDKYYPEYAEYASNYEFSHAQTAALNKLKEYKETYANVDELAGESGTITQAIKDIETYKANKNTAEQVNNELKAVEDAIELYNKTKLLEAEKTRLINKYQEVQNSTNDAAVKADTKEVIEQIKGVTLSGDASTYEEKMEELKNLEKATDKNLKEALDKIAADKEEARREAVADITPVIDTYIDIAKTSGRNAVVTALTGYKDSITTAEDAEAVSAEIELMNAYIDESCKVLKLQYTAINDLLTKVYPTTYANVAKYKPYLTEIKAVIDEGVEAIKAIKVEDWNDETTMKAEIEKIAKITTSTVDSGTVKDKIDAIEIKITALQTEKDRVAKDSSGTIYVEIAKYNTGVQEELKAYVKDIVDQINSITSDDENYTEIKKLEKLALDNIKSHVIGSIASDARNSEKTTAASGTVKNKDLTNVQSNVSISKDFDITVEVKKVEGAWTDFNADSDNTGYFVCLVVDNKYAKKLTATLSDNGKVVIDETSLDSNGKVTIIARVGDDSAVADGMKAKTLTIKFFDGDDTSDGKAVYTQEYTLKGLTIATE